MSERPWYKRYASDFITGTLGMSLEEKGAYSLVLDMIYDRGRPIPDDARYIAGVCGCSVRRWNTIRQRLIDMGKIEARDGTITNPRAEKEIENAAKIARKLAENGAKGGNKRAENIAASNEINDIAVAELPLTRVLQKPDTREEKKERTSLRDGAAAPRLVGPKKSETEEAALFRRAREIFSGKPGGVITQLRKACEYDDAYALTLVEEAGEKDQPMEWLQGVLRNHDPDVAAIRGVINCPQHRNHIKSKADREWAAAERRIYDGVL